MQGMNTIQSAWEMAAGPLRGIPEQFWADLGPIAKLGKRRHKKGLPEGSPN
jgi:hypothetical protein